MPFNVFIGSSTEALPFARAIQANLFKEADVTIWDQHKFLPGEFVLESLIRALKQSDYGIFVFASDDLAMVRGDLHPVVRDNVLIELGLFIGQLGRERIAIFVPDEVDVRIPSDLKGLNTVRFPVRRADGNLTSALAPACDGVREAISQRSNAKVTPEQTQIFLERWIRLTNQQKSLVQYIWQYRRSPIVKLHEEFKDFSFGELFYRLENLRLLQMLERTNGPEQVNGDSRQYALTSLFKAVYSSLLRDNGSDGSQIGGIDGWPALTERVPLDGEQTIKPAGSPEATKAEDQSQ